jgi:choline dehydrogenase
LTDSARGRLGEPRGNAGRRAASRATAEAGRLYFSPLSYTRAPKGDRPLTSPDPFPGFLLSAQPCRPTSRGHVEIRSPDPFDVPRIEPNSLSTEHDLEELVEGARFLRALVATPLLRAVIEQELHPGPQVMTRERKVDDIR